MKVSVEEKTTSPDIVTQDGQEKLGHGTQHTIGEGNTATVVQGTSCHTEEAG